MCPSQVPFSFRYVADSFLPVVGVMTVSGAGNICSINSERIRGLARLHFKCQGQTQFKDNGRIFDGGGWGSLRNVSNQLKACQKQSGPMCDMRTRRQNLKIVVPFN